MKRIKRPDGDGVKRSAEGTEYGPLGPWDADKEDGVDTRGNSWGTWTEDRKPGMRDGNS